MDIEQIKRAVRELALSDRLALIEQIWFELAAEQEQLPIPDWQKQALEQRFRAWQTEEQTLYDWQAVHQSLRKQHG